ncbi:MAG: DUF7117 family protein [Halobacteriota archaeon]
MEPSGERTCLECGETWSADRYACPECGSPRSQRGVPAPEFDVAELLEGGLRQALGEAEERCREYTARHDFDDGDGVDELDVRYVMACEIKYLAAELLDHTREIDESERAYVVEMLRGVAEAEPPGERPKSLDAAHRLAVAEAVEDYGRALAAWCRERDLWDTDVGDAVERARTKAKRTRATEGSVDDAVEGLRLLRDVHDEYVA